MTSFKTCFFASQLQSWKKKSPKSNLAMSRMALWLPKVISIKFNTETPKPFEMAIKALLTTSE